MASLPKCEQSGKFKYPSELAAIRRAIRSSAKRGTPLRVYRCPACRSFHLTKKKQFASTVVDINERTAS